MILKNYEQRLKDSNLKKILNADNYFKKIEEEITKTTNEIEISKNENSVSKDRQKIRKLKSKLKNFKKRITYIISTKKTEKNFLEEQIKFITFNFEKIEKLNARSKNKQEKTTSEIEELGLELKNKFTSKTMFTEFKKNNKLIKKIYFKNKLLTTKLNKTKSNIITLDELILESNLELESFNEEDSILFKNEIEKIKNIIKIYNEKKFYFENKILKYTNEIESNIKLLNQLPLNNEEATNILEKKSKLLNLKIELQNQNLEISVQLKQINKRKKELAIKKIKLIYLENYIEKLSQYASMELNLITQQNSKITKAFNIVEKILLKDWFFVVITAMLSAGVVLGTYLYIEYGVGALNEIFVVVMLQEGLDKGDFSAAIGFATGFLLARILEGPLVGILDVGGSILTGVGIGIPAVFLSTGKIAWMMHNPVMALLIGLCAGIIIGLIILLVRFLKPKTVRGLGTDVMIGAGNATGKFLGPLVIFSAAMYNPLIGIGAGIGASLFMWIKKPIVGGAIIGAMLFGIIPAFLV